MAHFFYIFFISNSFCYTFTILNTDKNFDKFKNFITRTFLPYRQKLENSIIPSLRIKIFLFRINGKMYKMKLYLPNICVL